MAAKGIGKSAKAVLAQFDSSAQILFGALKETDSDDGQIMLSTQPGCAKWVTIPLDSVEEIELLHFVDCLDHEHPFVRLRLKKPAHPEGILYSRLASLKAASVASISAPNVTLGLPPDCVFNGQGWVRWTGSVWAPC